ncbi:type I-E CRISPR-associated protein Cas7/Cse4/CasC [uncultured Thiodictyon sp.]|uniref:type I-E CRISPR-associated protein Cas7/Cse4/CasC n=1 Tax=uncultured Thiodictyon sp. TaxID=1846217 RepID=UPI0025D7819C|nr:type I-E CRISPR-associated protein Cas7/Cse4/CasC [uncultured Thiodictyon sp.]
MTARNFVNLHVLISHSPSCLNRDDMNMQKTAVFGGRTRVRISSQSLKRAMRTSPYYHSTLGVPSVRTRDLGLLTERFVERLKDRYDADLIAQALALMSGKEGIATGEDADAVAPWSVDEVAYFCELIRAGETDAKQIEKRILKEAAPFRAAMSKALDIALSGRMATSGLMTHLPVDGALAIAHAITTHAVEPQDVDWFTAVDDLTQDAGETGAGHLNTQQFSAGVFYRYASLNLRQLQLNLGLIPTIDAPETPASRARALEIARHALHLLATVVPDAKQQSFAAHNLADFVIASLADQPVSLANAFEQPVERDKKLSGYLQPSIDQLASYWSRVNRAYGLNEQARAFALPEGIQLGDRPALDTLTELENWITRDGQD